ncbi:dihydrodipicolinate synthase family protein [Microlunatus soli]|uniref:exo-alpha-sialidase n=1 Tax=Microlunatus soli TaxID=630515 RepID=A0A1H1YKK1_9ACTN|nr:dihydrodipicolinate synthase family protein [Microlunatus soli]SDT21586.1 Dihydrodipicolinate synthase/N-acetylneuraminate lyase [Microlunatus soli]
MSSPPFDPAGTDYNTFRIPALLAIPAPGAGADPLLLAFCEGRIESSADHGPIELVLRRSVDGGRSWQPLQVVCRVEAKTCGNPVPILDPASGDVVLVSTQNGAGTRESAIVQGAADPGDARRVYVQRSPDLGLTWTDPVEITDQVSRPDWGWYATGPCHGIALQHGAHRGRLVVPANHSIIPADGVVPDDRDALYGGHCILSDDGGRSWRIGFVAEHQGDAINPNETTVAELADGRVIFNARNYHGTRGRRVQAVSQDGGETLAHRYTDCRRVSAPDIQGSLISPDGRLLLLSTPARQSSRQDLTIFVSDDASTWRRGAMINSGFSGYSDLALLDQDRVAVLYEAGSAASNEEIRFTVRATADLITETPNVNEDEEGDAAQRIPTTPRFAGVIPPLVTPLTDTGDLDHSSLNRLVDHVFDGGASGVFVLGSTGEGTSFGAGRRSELIGATVRAVAGRGPVLVGILAPSTEAAIELATDAIAAGASALVATAPFYVATHPAEIEQHFRMIAAAIGDTPLLAYNIPSRSGTRIAPELMIKLAADGVISGIKDSSGSLPDLRRLITGRTAAGLTGLSILTGSEVTADLSVLLGVDGIIPGIANVDTAMFVTIIEQVRSGRLAEAQAEQQRVLGLFEILGVPDRGRISASSSSIGAVKAALRYLGVIDSVRPAPPLMPVDAEEIARIGKLLDAVGIRPRNADD